MINTIVLRQAGATITIVQSEATSACLLRDGRQHKKLEDVVGDGRYKCVQIPLFFYVIYYSLHSWINSSLQNCIFNDVTLVSLSIIHYHLIIMWAMIWLFTII